MNLFSSVKLMQVFPDLIPRGVLHGLFYHSAVFICSVCHSFTSAGSFYVRMPGDSLLADEGSAELKSLGTNRRLSDKETENVGQKSCEQWGHLGAAKNVDSYFLYLLF